MTDIGMQTGTDIDCIYSTRKVYTYSFFDTHSKLAIEPS